MRAALVTSYLSHAGGGVSAVVEALSRSLHAMSPDVRVIGLCDSHWQSEALDWRGTPAAALRVRGPSSIGYAPSALRKLREVDASIIHTHGLWSYPSRAVSLWSARTGRPYLVSPHGMLDSWAMRRAPWKKAIAAYLYENTHLRHASCLHALLQCRSAVHPPAEVRQSNMYYPQRRNAAGHSARQRSRTLARSNSGGC